VVDKVDPGLDVARAQTPDDPPFGAVQVGKKAEMCPQLIAESVQAGWRDREYADA
jgi:hypothetical protein